MEIHKEATQMIMKKNNNKSITKERISFNCGGPDLVN